MIWFKGKSKMGAPIYFHKRNIVSWSVSPENVSPRQITVNLAYDITHYLEFNAYLEQNLLKMMENDNQRTS